MRDGRHVVGRTTLVPFIAALGAVGGCGKDKPAAASSAEAFEVPPLIAAGKEEIVAEMVRKAKPPETIERVWNPGCEDVGVFTLAQGCLPMQHARMRVFAGGFTLVLGSKEAPTCDHVYGPCLAKGQPELCVDLPGGVQRSDASGRPIGAQSRLEYPGGRSLSTGSGPSRITLDPDTFARGGPVTGTLTIDGVGQGRFSADRCPDDFASVWEGPDGEPAPTLKVKVSGRQFHPVTTLFHAHTFVGGSEGLSAHVFDTKADCQTPEEQGVVAGSFAFGNPRLPDLVGTPQPGGAVYPSFEQRAMLHAEGWAVWEEVTMKPGGRVRARLHAESPPGTSVERSLSVSGPLEGTVCPRTR